MQADPRSDDTRLTVDGTWSEANALAAAGDWAGAAAAYARLADATPGDAAAWLGLAKALARAGRYRAMHAATMRAHAAGPRSSPHALALARLLRDLHEPRALTELSIALAARADHARADDMVALADLLGA